MSEQASAPLTGAPMFAATITVRWRDLDAFNHVNNSTYLTYLEEARLQWMQSMGDAFEPAATPVLAASELNYRRPIAWPAQLQVQLLCERVGNSSITIAHRMVDAGDPQTLYCDGRVVMVWIDPSTGKPVPLPPSVRQAAQHPAPSAGTAQ
ncbi:thioesterase [Rhodanobacter sp. Root627]|nr:thioesterase [Rhodanobacter sp. Root627]